MSDHRDPFREYVSDEITKAGILENALFNLLKNRIDTLITDRLSAFRQAIPILSEITEEEKQHRLKYQDLRMSCAADSIISPPKS